MANKSSFMLAVLLIANPFVMLFFQNCSGNVAQSKVLTAREKRLPSEKPQIRVPASVAEQQ